MLMQLASRVSRCQPTGLDTTSLTITPCQCQSDTSRGAAVVHVLVTCTATPARWQRIVLCDTYVHVQLIHTV